MSAHEQYPKFWQIIYKLYPPMLRVLERLGLHKGRQPHIIGLLKKEKTPSNILKHLIAAGFETVLLAWKDTDEILSLRKVTDKIFQYHIRLYSDGEIRGHYEYSPEGNPWGHIVEKTFEKRSDFFKNLLEGYLE